MRVVLDTNVVVSGVLSPTGASRALLDLTRHGKISIVTSWRLLEELEEVLTRFMPHEAAAAIRSSVEELAQLVEPEEVPSGSRDPDDDHVLAAAVEGSAACIVTRDKDLLDLGWYRGIQLLEPAPTLHALRSSLE